MWEALASVLRLVSGQRGCRSSSRSVLKGIETGGRTCERIPADRRSAPDPRGCHAALHPRVRAQLARFAAPEAGDRLGPGAPALRSGDGHLRRRRRVSDQPPRPADVSALPSPVVSLLDGVSISDPGPLMRMSQALRERHFRRDLEEMAGRSLQQLLDELRPRLRHWFVATINALRESFRLQTDPLRYRQPVRASNGSTAGDSSLMVDIEFLRGQAVQAEVPGGPQTEIETTRS